MKWPFGSRSTSMMIVVGIAAFFLGFSLAILVSNVRRDTPAQIVGHTDSGRFESEADEAIAIKPHEESGADSIEGVNAISAADSGSLSESEQGLVSMPEAMTAPVDGSVVAGYGWRRDPVMDDWRFTDGIDISCLPGTQVRAALSGKVAGVDRDGRGVLVVRLEHAGGVETVYENLRIAWVKAGDEVGQGASLGEVGASSAASDGECIIRFIVLERGNAIDPVQCIGKRF